MRPPCAVACECACHRPGANITGITALNGLIGTKWLGLFHDLLPSATRFVVLINPNDRDEESIAENVKPLASANGWQIETVEAATNDEIDTAFASLVRQRAEALMIAPGAMFRQRLVKLATLATRHAIPAIYPIPQFSEAGGLMSYGTSFLDIFRQAGASLRTCRFCSRPSLNLSSISAPPRRSVSRSRPACSR